MKNSLRSFTLRRDLPGASEVPPAIAKQNVSETINEEEYLRIRASILALIKRAGLTGDSLEHSHCAVLAAVDLQWMFQNRMERLLNDAKAAGDRLRDPSSVLAPQVANHIRRELKRVTFATWIVPHFASISKLCCYLLVCCTIVYVTSILQQRNRPEVEKLVAAAGNNLNGWTKFEIQNDLLSMSQSCEKYPTNAVDPQGRRYCFVLVNMNEVSAAAAPTLPAWASSSRDGSGR